MKPFFLFVVLLVILGCNSNPASNTSPESTTQLPDVMEATSVINNFFKMYKDDGTAKAIDYIFSTNASLSDTNQLATLKNKLDSTRRQIGNFNRQELITQKSSSNSLVLFSYLVKHDKQPLRFTFIFYKPKNNWTLYKFKFDDETDTELEESGKIYFIK